MESYKRILDLNALLQKKSFFLFGPRSTGKTTLIHQQLPDAKVYDLLDAEVFARLVRRPKLLLEENPSPSRIIAIDEIQKLPSLLDEIHRLIARYNMRFLLTGSSARKLKRGAANLLAGRAWQAALFALTWREIPAFDLLTYLNTGGLPHIYGNPDAGEELDSYVSLYLQEEVQAEALTRNIQGFAQFLDAIALCNGEEINYQSLASDCGVLARTLKNYVEILQDTLIGYCLSPFTLTKKRKAITRQKHFLFDVGVVNSLCQRGEIRPRSELFGKAFEHFIINEVRAYVSYQRLRHRLQYWRSTSGFEVDLIVGQEMAIEIKSASLVSDKHLKGLRALKEEGLVKNYGVVSLDPEVRTTRDGVTIYPWAHFLRRLWQDEMV
jgi:predicted AAA+ superfamily ATPase